jgi:hypothetical protein
MLMIAAVISHLKRHFASTLPFSRLFGATDGSKRQQAATQSKADNRSILAVRMLDPATSSTPSQSAANAVCFVC